LGDLNIKRTLLTLVILSGITLVWTRYFMPKAAPPQAQSAQPPSTAPAQPAGKSPDAGVAAAPTQPTEGAPETKHEPLPREQRVTLDTSAWKATFTSYGAQLAAFELKDSQYRSKVGGVDVPLDLVRSAAARPMLTTTIEAGATSAGDGSPWKVERQTSDEVVFSRQEGGVRLAKSFRVDPSQSHSILMGVSVENHTDKPLGAKMALAVFGRHDFGQKSGIGRPAPNTWMPACYSDGKAQKHTFDQLKDKGPLNLTGDVRWAAVEDRYFIMALAPAPDAARQPRTCLAQVIDASQGMFDARIQFPEMNVPVGQTSTQSVTVFAGPKLLKELDAVTAGGQDAKLGEAVDYGWWSPISRVLLWVLVTLHRATASWGLSIIILTVFIKMLTYPLSQKAMKSGREMAKLKPKVEALQKRYADDKQRQQAEMMNLYKQHGVNPLGGCLPTLIQLPIWWGLYATLGNAVELYRSSFLWMPDLTQADPLYITPIAMGAFMFVQQRITPMPADSEQQKMMMYIMPAVFTFMSLWFPAGLTVYILTNTLLTMVQQWWSNRAGNELKPARAS
jgi:YidC/Oxa1 family membrane protein insertase